MTQPIDLNADLGEGCSDDAAIMVYITSCNIACGGHAGDATSMETALALAAEHDVAPGAHPAYPDRAGFGRQPWQGSTQSLADIIRRQVEALAGLAVRRGTPLTHLKPHGQLYHDASADRALADILVACAMEILEGAALVGPPGRSALRERTEQAGLIYRAEGFVDRTYDRGGGLVPRDRAGALIEAEEARIAQALAIARDREVATLHGDRITIAVDTICLHSDSPDAARSAEAVRRALQIAGVEVRAPG